MIDVWFTWPVSWPWLLVMPLLLVVGATVARRRARRATLLLGRRERALAGAPAFSRWRAGLAFGSAVAVVVALAGPVTLGGEERVGADVVLCVDVSRSMAARDHEPSRLGVAQAQIGTLAAAAPGARLALVPFAGSASVMVPLSADLSAVAQLARDLVPGTLGKPGSNLAAAIELGSEVLRRGAAGGGGSIVVLTDGEDFAGDGALAAAAVRRGGARVDCVGVGREPGSKIVIDDGGTEVFLRDAAGVEVVTRLEADTLRAVAAAGGGRFVTADDGNALRSLYTHELVPAAAAAALARGAVEPVPAFQWPLCLALCLWGLCRALPEHRR